MTFCNSTQNFRKHSTFEATLCVAGQFENSVQGEFQIRSSRKEPSQSGISSLRQKYKYKNTSREIQIQIQIQKIKYEVQERSPANQVSRPSVKNTNTKTQVEKYKYKYKYKKSNTKFKKGAQPIR